LAVTVEGLSGFVKLNTTALSRGTLTALSTTLTLDKAKGASGFDGGAEAPPLPPPHAVSVIANIGATSIRIIYFPP
jgi:hypothetical protein